MKAPPRLCIVIPCYNETAVLPKTAPLFRAELTALVNSGRIAPDSRILFVNDGSADDTWGVICDLHRQDDVYRGVSLSRNRGHQNALLCGLHEARTFADIIISADCDGQDDIHAMEEMLSAYDEGNECTPVETTARPTHGSSARQRFSSTALSRG